jgi:signal transduction histidine kinase
VDIESGLPPGLGDHGRHLQVLNNLLSNAMKFSPADTSVYVGATRQDGEIRVSVRDEGPGISPADLPKLFRRFSRLDNPHYRGVKGTGLGLFICRSLVEGQGGRIWAEGGSGSGVTFTSSIPLAP